jgi:hypothetical protein
MYVCMYGYSRRVVAKKPPVSDSLGRRVEVVRKMRGGKGRGSSNWHGCFFGIKARQGIAWHGMVKVVQQRGVRDAGTAFS